MGEKNQARYAALGLQGGKSKSVMDGRIEGEDQWMRSVEEKEKQLI